VRVLVHKDETDASTETTTFHVFILSLKQCISPRIVLEEGQSLAAFHGGAIILDGANSFGSGPSSSTGARKSELLIRAVLLLGGSIAPYFEERSGFHWLQAHQTNDGDTDLFYPINSVLASRRAWAVKELEVAARISEKLNVLREEFIGLSTEQERIDDLIREVNDENKALLSEWTQNSLYSQSLKLKQVAGNSLVAALDISKAADTRIRCRGTSSTSRYSLAIDRTRRKPLWPQVYGTGLACFVLAACAIATCVSIPRLMAIRRSRRDHPVDVHVYGKLSNSQSLRRRSGGIITKRAGVNIPRRQRAAATEEERKSLEAFRRMSA